MWINEWLLQLIWNTIHSISMISKPLYLLIINIRQSLKDKIFNGPICKKNHHTLHSKSAIFVIVCNSIIQLLQRVHILLKKTHTVLKIINIAESPIWCLFKKSSIPKRKFLRNNAKNYNAFFKVIITVVSYAKLSNGHESK